MRIPVGVLLVVGVALCCSGGATAAPLDGREEEPEVRFIEFGPIINGDESVSQLDDNIYMANTTLDRGYPSAEATVCTWIFLQQRHRLDSLFVMYGSTDASDEDFYSVSLAVYTSQLRIQTMDCDLQFEYIVELRKWIHVCVAMGSTISVFVDGEPLNGSCHHEGTEVLTSDNGCMVLGSNPIVQSLIYGKLAGVCLYASEFDAVTVKSERSNALPGSDCTNIITKDWDKSQYLGTGIGIDYMKRTQLLSPPPENIWIYVPELSFADAVDVCHRFGGDLLNVTEERDSFMRTYTFEVLKEIFIEIWVKTTSNCSTATVTSAGTKTKVKKCQAMYTSICSIPRKTEFRMISKNMKSISVSLVEQNKYTFDADYYYRLEYIPSDRRFSLIFVDDNAELGHAILPIHQLMGRHTWTFGYAKHERQIEVTVTACNENQFTCSSGHCINLNDICNFRPDCEDFSDEELCNNTQKMPTFYDSNLSGKDKLPVGLLVSLLRILDIDMDDGTVQTELLVVAKWRDTRVVFHNLHPNETTLVNVQDVKRYWQPNIELGGVVNEDTDSMSMAEEPEKMFITAMKSGKATTFDSQEVMQHQGKDVEITHRKMKIVTLLCTLDLFFYPFDVQTCNLTLNLIGLILDDAMWNVSDVEAAVRPSLSMQLYELIHFSLTVGEGHGNPVTLELQVMRLYGSHILVTFWPCMVLHMIGLSVFILPLDDLSNRLTISISCFIVMAALFTQISSTLPVSASPKLIDIWMFVHVLLLSFVFFGQLLLHKIHTSLATRPDKTNEITPLKQPPVWLVGVDKEEEDDEDMDEEDLSFPVTANKWAAILSLVVYAVFVTTFFLLVTFERLSYV